MTLDEEIDQLTCRAINIKGQIEYHLLLKLEATLPDVYVRVLSRIKTKSSIRKKIEDKRNDGRPEYSLKDLTDIIGFRIVCHFQSDVQKVVRLLLEINRAQRVLLGLHEPGRLYTTLTPAMPKLLKTMRAVFNEFGYPFEDTAKESQYTSLHLVCEAMEDFPPIEFQIRNVFEDAWASIEHATYKAQTVSGSVRRHLSVLATLIQGCVEYAEAIRADLSTESLDDSASVKPITEYPGDWNRLSHAEKSFLERLYQMRNEEQHLDILSEIQGYRQSEADIQNEELNYVLQMERALSLLKLNRPAEAQAEYESIASRFPERAIVSFRISELHRLMGDYPQALAAIEQAELLMEQSATSNGDKRWLERHLPLKKAYLLWKYEGADAAWAAISGPFEKLAKDDELQRSYFNSIVYYALESSRRPEAPVLRRYLERMKAEGMASTDTARPELVDTYAWLCFAVGEWAEARRAMDEVMQCIRSGSDGASWFEHGKKRWLIPTHDMLAVLRHASEILKKVGAPAVNR